MYSNINYISFIYYTNQKSAMISCRQARLARPQQLLSAAERWGEIRSTSASRVMAIHPPSYMGIMGIFNSE